MRNSLNWLNTTFCTLLLVVGGYSQTTISVVALPENTPVANAMILINNAPKTGNTCFTDPNGKVVVPTEMLPSGGYFSFHIIADGFPVYCDSMPVNTSKTCTLTPLANNIEEVVITAQIQPSKAENSVQKVTIISREKIDAKGATNLRDVLQNELNIRISQDQVLGSSLTMKGLGGEGIKIMIDGVPLTGRNDGNIDLSQINLANIERIELVEGPLSVNYGSNAIAGTINLITKKTAKKGHQLSANTLYESSGHYNMNGSYGFSKGKHQLTLNGGRNYFDGWTDGDPQFEFPKEKPADSSRFKSWKPKEQFVYGMRYRLQLKNWQFAPFADMFTEKITNRGMPKAPYQITAFDDNYFTQRFNTGMHVNGRFKHLGFKGLFGYNTYNRIKNTYITDLTTLDRQLTANPGDQDTTRFQLYFSRIAITRSQPEAKLNYETGLEINRESGYGTRIEGREKTLGDYAIYGIAEYQPFQRFIVSPGVRCNYNTAYGTVAVPSVNVKYRLKAHTLRLNYARGFRTPSIKELYMEFVDINHNILGNSNLQPESSDHYQLWYTLSDTVAKKYVMTYELNPFFQEIHQKINLAQSGDGTVYSYFNIDRYTAAGAQFSVQFQGKQLQVKTGFSYLGIASNYTDNRFYYTPELSSSITYELPKIPIVWSAFYKYTGKVSAFYLNEDQTIEPIFIADYHLLDVQMSTTFWKKNIRLAAGTRNLLNVKNITANSGSGAHSGGTSTPIAVGRTYYLSLIFQLNLTK